MKSIVFSFLLLLVSCSADNSRLSISADAPTLKSIVSQRKIPKDELHIVVRKAVRKLTVYYKTETLITYPCVLGFSPEGDKMQEGDGKTPEGKFNILSMYPHKSWSYFIWFDYPNAVSRQRFKERKADGTISGNAGIGGEVGIHGVPTGRNDLIEKNSDWTLGCISLTTENITDLYQSIGTKTTIEILK